MEIGDILELTFNQKENYGKYPFLLSTEVTKDAPTPSHPIEVRRFSGVIYLILYQSRKHIEEPAIDIITNFNNNNNGNNSNVTNINIEKEEKEENEVKKWIESLKIEQLKEYIPKLIQEGFTTLTTISMLSNEDLTELGFKLAHRKLMLSALSQLNNSSQQPIPRYIFSRFFQEFSFPDNIIFQYSNRKYYRQFVIIT